MVPSLRLHCNPGGIFFVVYTSLPQEGTVLGLLRELGHDPQRVAVEKNGSIVPRAAFAEEKLTDADHLEVVCFVGGG